MAMKCYQVTSTFAYWWGAACEDLMKLYESLGVDLIVLDLSVLLDEGIDICLKEVKNGSENGKG